MNNKYPVAFWRDVDKDSLGGHWLELTYFSLRIKDYLMTRPWGIWAGASGSGFGLFCFCFPFHVLYHFGFLDVKRMHSGDQGEAMAFG